MKTKNTAQISNDNQADVTARLAALKKEERRLEKQLEKRLARGTGDVTEQADRASGRTAPKSEPGNTDPKPPSIGPMLDLGERIESLLRTKPHSIDELAKELKEPVGKVASALKPMRGRLFNAGTEHEPSWFWIVGDHASATEINNAVRALVTYRPMRFPELIAATGARQGRVSGAIVAMQRDSKSRIANLGSPVAARWFVVPEGIALARLRAR